MSRGEAAMRIFLSGLMGSGKSTLARALAGQSGLARFDTDELITRETGLSVTELFRARGEEEFRAIEARVIEGLIEREPAGVFALGGGAVTQRALRRTLLRSGCLVTLDAPSAVLAGRVGRGEGRPLLEGGEVRARLDALRSARAEAYAECHLRLDTSDLAPAEAARVVLEAARREPIAVPLGVRSYCIHVG